MAGQHSFGLLVGLTEPGWRAVCAFMQQLLAERVLGPLGLDNTTDPGTPAITEPALHAYSSERRYALEIPAVVPFTEDVTYWNPSWTITHGAIQTTDIHAHACL